VTETLQGVSITDPYRWLEDQTSPETRSWIDRQNAYTDSVLGPRPEKEIFARRLTDLLKTEQIGTPFLRGGHYFFMKRPAGADLYAIYMREGAAGADQVLIDPTSWNEKHTTNVSIEDITPDGRMLAYSVRQGGADETEVRFYDVNERKDVGLALTSARYQGVSLTPDHRMVYFSRFLKEGGHVYRRSLDGGSEEKLFGDGYGPDKIVASGLSDDGKYLLIYVFYGSAGQKTELYIKDLANDGPIRTIVNDLDAQSSVQAAGDTLVIDTNWNAPNSRVMVVPAANPTRDHWKEIIPENKAAALEGVTLAGGKVFARYLENVKPRLVVYDTAGSKESEISFDTLGQLEAVSGVWDSPVAFFGFSSFHVPRTIYTYDVNKGTRSVFYRVDAPVDSDQFTVEQVWYPSKDGTRIPMFLLYKKGLQRDGTHPTYLTGYGGFNNSLVPTFSTRAVAWVEQGGLYAVPNLRGGGEFGEKWHRAGMLESKQNVFDDFIAAGEYLIREHYTSRDHLGIAGGSNGGLLVTAVATQRPDLVKAVICSFPLIDMLRYHQFLVGSFWVPEYGSSADPAQFKWIYAYSPYQHVKKGTKYPSVLFITGDADTRVAPLHARKMTALMQASTGSDNPILLRYHTASGHSGGEPLPEQVKNEAESLGFLWWQLK
jgi:prolyl oligopeptidase